MFHVERGNGYKEGMSMMLDGEMMEILKDMEDRYTEAAVILEGMEDDRFSRRAEALRLAISHMTAPDWVICEKDGNPDKEGEYTCVVCYRANDGKTYATIESRWCSKYHPDDGWVMKGQPEDEDAYVWYEGVGSYKDEWVYAWIPTVIERKSVILPEGVKWE